MNALSIHNLHKTYRNGFEALKGISLEVEAGDFFALLGPNGAGKSTAIGIVASLVNKTAGRISIFDHDLDRQRELAKQQIGLVPQEFNFNQWEPVVEILVNQAGYYGIPRREAFVRAEKKNYDFFFAYLSTHTDEDVTNDLAWSEEERLAARVVLRTWGLLIETAMGSIGENDI